MINNSSTLNNYDVQFIFYFTLIFVFNVLVFCLGRDG